MMEKDKENINRSPPKSRIPVPLRTATQNLNEHVNRNVSNGSKRLPLKTIDHHNMHAGPSHVNLKRPFLRLDTKHVTFRDKKETKPYISHDVPDVIKDLKNSIQNIKINDAESTPFDPKLVVENNRIKNIKRSLKRPHSRELQGITPERKQENNRNMHITRYKESLRDRLESPDFLNRSYMTCLARDYVEDVYTYLLEAERKPLNEPQIKNFTRACLINWIMKVNRSNEQPSTVQTACWYLDSILGTGYVNLENLQLVAAASYWIAEKINGPYMSASKLVICANMAFTCQKLMAAERAVLVKLDFPPQPIVPQDFISYLAWWCDSEHPGDIELAATFLCMAGLMVDKAFCQDYPSVIALAAVRNALLLYKGKHLIKRLMLCPLYNVIELKAEQLSRTCSMQRRAVRTVANQDYEYKAPYEQFGFSPHNIAQKVISAAFKLYESDKNM